MHEDEEGFMWEDVIFLGIPALKLVDEILDKFPSGTIDPKVI